MRFDLHTHSTCSDGSLSPSELLTYATECGVDVLAITDHDTVDAFNSGSIDSTAGIRLVTGVELSTVWRGRGIHVVGLNVDTSGEMMVEGLRRQRAARMTRAGEIARKLERLGISNPLDAVLEKANGCPGRPHFAAHLVEIGFVKDEKTAFKRYLGPGKIGDVKQHWAGLDEVVGWIRGSGGTAVLAHPAKYRLSKTLLRCLVETFHEAGGRAIEVSCGSQDPGVTSMLGRLANEAGLMASCGSDFHHRSQSWSQPGRFAPLPPGVRPVWDAW